MNGRKGWTIATVIGAVVAAAAFAMAANLGLLSMAGADDKIGELDAGDVPQLLDEADDDPVVDTTSTTEVTVTSTTAAPATLPPIVPPTAPPVTIDDDGTPDQGSGDVSPASGDIPVVTIDDHGGDDDRADELEDELEDLQDDLEDEADDDHHGDDDDD